MDKLIDQNQISAFKRFVEDSNEAVIVPHVNPDGDAIGSCLAFLQVLESMNKRATVVIPNDFPEFLQWIDGSDRVVNYLKEGKKANQAFKSADTLFVLDFNDYERSEYLTKSLNSYVGASVMIDHHPDPVAPCDLKISYPAVSSTCELLYRLLERSNMLEYLNKQGAEAIFTGMMTDTGNFSYNASDPETYRIIAGLLEIGADKDKVHENVYHTFSASRWRLIGHSLKDKMVILPEYSTGYLTLTKKELDVFDFQPGDTEGLVNYPLMVKGISFCVLFMEKDDHVKLSLRSKGNFDVNQFARAFFNGGGHRNAAGGKTTLKIKDATEKLISLLPQYEKELKNSQY